MEIQKVKVTQTRKDAIFKNIKKEPLQREERIQNDDGETRSKPISQEASKNVWEVT